MIMDENSYNSYRKVFTRDNYTYEIKYFIYGSESKLKRKLIKNKTNKTNKNFELIINGTIILY